MNRHNHGAYRAPNTNRCNCFYFKAGKQRIRLNALLMGSYILYQRLLRDCFIQKTFLPCVESNQVITKYVVSNGSTTLFLSINYLWKKDSSNSFFEEWGERNICGMFNRPSAGCFSIICSSHSAEVQVHPNSSRLSAVFVKETAKLANWMMESLAYAKHGPNCTAKGKPGLPNF